MWKIERMSVINPSFPWIPPSGEWVLVSIHLTADAMPVISVIIVVHHKICVALLLSWLNFANQLLLPKCKNIWAQTSPIKNNPIIIWSHTEKLPVLCITSSCIPEINTATEATSRPQLQSFNLVISFMLFQGCKHSVGTCTDTFIAPYASVGIDYPHMLVKRERDFSEYLFRTSRNTLPACDTIVRIDGNKRCCHTLLQFWE